MNILVLGDVFGQPGREAVKTHLPALRRDLAVDVAVVNAENAAHGFGLTEKICGELYDSGADVLTTGNHVWDQREIIPYFERDRRLLRPANFPPGTVGAGTYRHALADGRSLFVCNLMGRLFMDALDDPFRALDATLAGATLGDGAAVLIDFHGEATSEKTALGHHADGRVSALVGTHTHVPTADYQILPGGTGYISDLGMCGNYDSVIGLEKTAAVRRFVTRMPGPKKPEPADGEATVCGVFIVTDDATGLCRRIEPVRTGGRLAPHLPRL
ncbi:MAG: YmdB family metallophosphoesterase [Alphaproteobacteria bacterium]|nr:YmdB family metallophosphoesterase [Alphaproteobacteria bacterium]